MSTPEFKLYQYDPNESMEALLNAAAAYYDGRYQPDWDLDEIHLELLRAEHIDVQPLAELADFDVPDEEALQMVVVEEFDSEDMGVARAVEAEPDLDFMMGRFSRGIGMPAPQKDFSNRMRM